MHDVPIDLLQQIKELEQQFTIETPKLNRIVDRFQSELEKGMANSMVGVRWRVC